MSQSERSSIMEEWLRDDPQETVSSGTPTTSQERRSTQSTTPQTTQAVTQHKSSASSVWKFFTKVFDRETNTESAICRFCSKAMRVPKTKTTSNLLHHIRNKHEKEAEEFEKQESEHREQQQQKQPKIEEMFRRKISKASKENMDRKLVIFLAKASLPPNIIELQSFKELVQTLNPSYSAPTRKTLKKLMQKEVHSIDEGNKKLLCGDVKLAITVDEWSSKNASCALLAITGHVLKRDFSERANVVLDCVPLDEESHTSDVITSKILASFANLGIAANNVSFMVADGATVMIKAASDLGIQYIHCCAHVINLAVSSALNLPVCANALRKVKAIVSKLNKSGKMKKTFKRLLKEEKLPRVIPMTDAPTRWSSTYFMICDFLASISAIERLVTIFDMAPLEDGEIRTLKAMRTFLQPYQAATNQVCYQSSCCSMYIAVGKLLIAKTEANLSNARREGQLFGGRLLETTKEYFGRIFLSQTLRFAALCDPRFAFLEAVLSKDEWKETSNHFLMCKKDICDTPADEDVRTSPSPTPAVSEMWSLITSQPPSPPTRSSQMQEEDLQMELQQYSIYLNRGNARPHAESNPVNWWHNHQQQFPILASSALEYFAAPCTSVDSERLFSTAGIIFGNKRRQRLLGKTARLFLMINANTNKDTSRACKAWSQREVERYGPHESSSPPSTSSEQSSSEDSEEEFSEESVEI